MGFNETFCSKQSSKKSERTAELTEIQQKFSENITLIHFYILGQIFHQ